MTTEPAHSEGLRPGYGVSSPWRIPARGWVEILLRVQRRAVEDRLSLFAAAVTYYAVIGIFPAFIALVTVYALVSDPHDIVWQLNQLPVSMPESARGVVAQQLSSLAASPDSALSLGLISSLLVALWSASTGVAVLLQGVGVAYQVEPSRGFIRERLVAFAFAVGAILFLTCVLTATGGLAYLLQARAFPPAVTMVLTAARWLVLTGAAFVSLFCCYRYGPAKSRPPIRWLSPGALLATGIWLGGTAGFGMYVRSFGNYNETYGTLAGGVILMIWLYLSTFMILLGAEVNAEAQAQAAIGYPGPPPSA